ncbi:hypothetical protein [Leptospira ryugenii]|uniref:hypothetical protein n=1 Tax=Leptospira ryugenii TaxID=1917863 RepID=UPI00107F2111|nr:hypothetical protein [Leptospira ryugenii]
MEDQYQKSIQSKNLKNQTVVLMGCEKEDIELCRKIGRKIYWKLQNLLWKDSQRVHFIAYLNLTDSNSMIERYILESREKQFEPIYFDRKGELKEGLKKDFVFFRIFGKKGDILNAEHFKSIENESIQSIYKILKSDIQ